MMKVQVHHKDSLIAVQALPPGTTRIGRKEDNDIVLPDRTVSGHHARIHHAYGLAVLEDLGSTNGSSVNGKRVTRRALENGDIIVIGNCQLRFETDEKVRTDEPETQDSGPPTQILRVNTPGMPPGPVGGKATQHIRKLRAGVSSDPAELSLRLRFMSGRNQGRHLDLINTVTALGQPGQEVVALVREAGGLMLRVIEVNEGLVLVNGEVVAGGTRALKHHDIIQLGEVRMMVLFEHPIAAMEKGTEDWSLD
ncbi:FHA domain-containing protein [Thioalkalivibrio sulfidiphilus]|uniref:FHA domain-containing protein n=1 Tax=Thioalkalivibrio sulfidiphilus TaxID=1033854 RepID=UPI00037DFEDA|nr:FHA domain-containing protein [Thioalkalivibrio sulfidiphilus]